MLCAAGKKVEDYWDASKKLLGDSNKFLDSLLNFDKENIPDIIIKKIEPFIANYSFTPDAVAKVSKACTSICMWVRAMHLYHTVSLSVSGGTVAGALSHAARGRQRKDASKWLCSCHVYMPKDTAFGNACACAQVAPKRAALAAAQESLDKTLGELASAQARLAAVQEKIVTLEAQYEEATTKKATLAAQVSTLHCCCTRHISITQCCSADRTFRFSEILSVHDLIRTCATSVVALHTWPLQVADCQVKLQRADKLIGGLGGERTRWAATVQQLQSDLHNVVGDVALAAGEFDSTADHYRPHSATYSEM